MRYTLLTVTESVTEAVTEAVEQESSLMEDLWQYFYNTYINPSEYYENLNMGTGSMLSVRMIIIGIFIGITLAGFAAVFNKRVLGALVRKLLKNECLSPDKAMTLDELGYDNILMRIAVKRSTSLRRVVKCRQEEEYNAELAEKRREYEQKRENNKNLPRFKETQYKINDLTDTFYIPDEMKYMADIKVDQKGITWIGAVFFIVIMTIALLIVLAVLPHILDLLNDLAGSIDTTPDNIL